MWAGASADQPLKDHAHLLTELCGSKKWLLTDSFWLELLSFPTPLTKCSPTDLASAVFPYCEKLGDTPSDRSRKPVMNAVVAELVDYSLLQECSGISQSFII